MTEDTAWRVTGFVLRVSSSFCLASVRENNWKNTCWKLRCFPYLVLAQIMKRGKYSYFYPGLN